MNFPMLIKRVRQALGETQEQFAARFDTHANTVSRWESGQYQAPYEVIAFVIIEGGGLPINGNLIVFLYVLLRDHLPAGAVEQVMRDHVERAAGVEAEYSNKHLEAYARELAGRLL